MDAAINQLIGKVADVFGQFDDRSRAGQRIENIAKLAARGALNFLPDEIVETIRIAK